MSRFGLMHMIATNICNWLKVLILETSHEIREMTSEHGKNNHTFIPFRSHEGDEDVKDDHHYQQNGRFANQLQRICKKQLSIVLDIERCRYVVLDLRSF